MRETQDLRELLFKEMDDLRAGKSSIEHAQQVSRRARAALNLMQRNIKVARFELEVRRGHAKVREADADGPIIDGEFQRLEGPTKRRK